jgi:hypothetical protein
VRQRRASRTRQRTPKLLAAARLSRPETPESRRRRARCRRAHDPPLDIPARLCPRAREGPAAPPARGRARQAAQAHTSLHNQRRSFAALNPDLYAENQDPDRRPELRPEQPPPTRHPNPPASDASARSSTSDNATALKTFRSSNKERHWGGYRKTSLLTTRPTRRTRQQRIPRATGRTRRPRRPSRSHHHRDRAYGANRRVSHEGARAQPATAPVLTPSRCPSHSTAFVNRRAPTR